jgi:hypothetical protein
LEIGLLPYLGIRKSETAMIKVGEKILRHYT